MKDVGGIGETRSHGQMAGWMEGRTDGIPHTRTDEDHLYSPLLPISGDKKGYVLKGINLLYKGGKSSSQG